MKRLPIETYVQLATKAMIIIQSGLSMAYIIPFYPLPSKGRQPVERQAVWGQAGAVRSPP